MKKTALIFGILCLIGSCLGEIVLAMRNSSDAKNISTIQKMMASPDNEAMKEVFAKTLKELGINNIEKYNPKDSENAMVFSLLGGIIGLITLVSLFFRRRKLSLIMIGILTAAVLVSYIITPSIDQDVAMATKQLATIVLLITLAGGGLYYIGSKKEIATV